VAASTADHLVLRVAAEELVRRVAGHHEADHEDAEQHQVNFSRKPMKPTAAAIRA